MNNHKYLTVRQYSDIYVIDLPAESGDALVQGDISAELTALLGGTRNKVVASFSKVATCGSSVIACLIVAQQRLKNSGAELKLCELSQHMREVFGRLQLEDRIFEIHETEHDAVAAFGG